MGKAQTVRVQDKARGRDPGVVKGQTVKARDRDKVLGSARVRDRDKVLGKGVDRAVRVRVRHWCP